MANFNFTVSTEPMARKMDGVTQNVQVVGGAVSAMQVAVIASEKAAADKICQSVDAGFYTLMRSRFSQRLSQFQSTMRSRAGSMFETGQAISRIQTQMLGDFNRIKARYLKLFDGLDHALAERVRAVDQSAMELSDSRASLLLNRHTQEAPLVLFGIKDTNHVALRATTARVKARTAESIEGLQDGAVNVMAHERALSSIVEERPASGGNLFFMPVVYAVSESASVPGAYNFDVYVPSGVDKGAQDAITAEVRRVGDELGSVSGVNAVGLRTAFMQKVAASPTDTRVAETMLGLFDASFARSALGKADNAAGSAWGGVS